MFLGHLLSDNIHFITASLFIRGLLLEPPHQLSSPLCRVQSKHRKWYRKKSFVIGVSYASNTHAATAASAPEHRSTRVVSRRSWPQAAGHKRLEGCARRAVQVPLCPPQSVCCSDVELACHHLLW